MLRASADEAKEAADWLATQVEGPQRHCHQLLERKRMVLVSMTFDAFRSDGS